MNGMTGPEHYREAERLIAEMPRRDLPHEDIAMIQRDAQVHATLALAAATALCGTDPDGSSYASDMNAWYRAASEGPGEKRRRAEAEAAELAEFAAEDRELAQAAGTEKS